MWVLGSADKHERQRMFNAGFTLEDPAEAGFRQVDGKGRPAPFEKDFVAVFYDIDIAEALVALAAIRMTEKVALCP